MLFSGLLMACVVDLDKLFYSVLWALVPCSLTLHLCSTKSPGSTFSSNKPDHMILFMLSVFWLQKDRHYLMEHNSVQNQNWQSGLHSIGVSCSCGGFDLIRDILKLNLLSRSTTISVMWTASRITVCKEIYFFSYLKNSKLFEFNF